MFDIMPKCGEKKIAFFFFFGIFLNNKIILLGVYMSGNIDLGTNFHILSKLG